MSGAPDAEVAVVGGGPAGSATAALLAEGGREVVLLEKAPSSREKPCGEYYNPGVVDALGRLGALDSLLERDHEALGGMWVRAPRGGDDDFLLSYPDGEGRREALGIRRRILDKVLLDHARARGVRVREGVRVSGVFEEQGRVAGVRLRVGSGGEELLRSRFVVGADGRNSAVSRSLGLDLPARGPRRLGLHAHFAGVAPRFGGLGEMHVSEDGASYCGLAPVGGGLVVAGLVVGLDERPAGEPVGRYFHRRLEEMPGVARLLSGARRVGAIRGVGPLSRRVRRTDGLGFLLVGDAAGFLDPFTGEGVMRALKGAELAASAIESALRSGSPEPLGYAEGRRGAFGEKDRLVGVVQLLLRRPGLLGWLLGRLAKRPGEAGVLSGALGDYRPAGGALRPGYLWRVMGPWGR